MLNLNINTIRSNYVLIDFNITKIFKNLTSKPITPTEEEIKNNTRARSAKLRVAEKI